MNTNFQRKLIVSLFAVWILVAGAHANIMSKEARQKALDRANALVSRSVEAVDGERLALAPAPFARDLGIRAEKTEEVAETKQVDPGLLLPRLADQLNPTGIFVFGGEYYLVFKEKKVKAGSEMSVPYEKNEYTVVISDIKHTHYTVSFGGSELQLKLK